MSPPRNPVRFTATDDADSNNILSVRALRVLPLNAYYALVGRDSGLLAYFFPEVVVILWFLFNWRSAPPWKWTILLTVVSVVGCFIILAPYSWNGGGGAVGNRYFLGVLPLVAFIAPEGSALAPLVLASCGFAFCFQLLRHPIDVSARPEVGVWRDSVRWLPIELTLIEDLPVRLDPLRSRIELFRDPTVYLYYMDPYTYFAEYPNGVPGMWIAGAARADIVVRTEEPVTRLSLTISSPISNAVSVSFAGETVHATLGPSRPALVSINAGGYKPVEGAHGLAYPLSIAAERAFVPKALGESDDDRNLGVFVSPVFCYGQPPLPRGFVPH